MKVLVVSIGSPKGAGLAESIRDYESRIVHYFKFEALEVRPQKITQRVEAKQVIEEESNDLRARVPDGFDLIALDERGVAWTTAQLAEYLEGAGLHGKPGVAFLIGGPLGLSDGLRREANKMVSLSSLTLPHEMARLVLAEQIYRAGTIQRGEPYHKA